MFRTKNRNMASVKLVLYYNDSKEKTFKNLFIRITHNRKPKYISMGIKVNPEKDWDPKSLRVKKSFPNSAKVNHYIAKKLAEAEAFALDLDSNAKTLTSQRVKNEVMGKPPEDFFSFADTLIHRLDQADKERTLIRYKSIVSKLRTYQNGKPFSLNDFTVPFLHDYEAYLKSIGNEVNTIHTNLKTLRAILYIAIREDRFPQEKNPFFKFKLKKAPVKKERLDEEEIEKISTIDLKPGINLYHTRNAFLFSFYCAGIRVGDLVSLKWENVNGGLNYKMSKTNQYRRLKIVRKAQEILDIYKSEHNKPTDFIFPFLDNAVDYSNNKFLMQQIGSKTSIINRKLKELAKKTEIHKKITSHTARHTFADLARKKGMKLYDISKALGHSSLKITEQYLSNFDDNSLDDAMDKLFD